jgi:hypothetical protein
VIRTVGTGRVQKRVFYAAATAESLFPVYKVQTYLQTLDPHPHTVQKESGTELEVSVPTCLSHCSCVFRNDTEMIEMRCCEYFPAKYTSLARYLPADVETGHSCELLPTIDLIMFRSYEESSMLLKEKGTKSKMRYDASLRTLIMSALPPFVLPVPSRESYPQNQIRSVALGPLPEAEPGPEQPSQDEGGYTVLVCHFKAIDTCFDGTHYAVPKIERSYVATAVDGTRIGDEDCRNVSSGDADESPSQITASLFDLTTSQTQTQLLRDNFRILLLGGSWESWCSMHWLVNNITLPIITFVSGTAMKTPSMNLIETVDVNEAVSEAPRLEMRSDKFTNFMSAAAVNVLLKAKNGIIYCHPDTQPKSDGEGTGFVYTGQDVIWPVILVRKINFPVHFVNYNELLVQVAYTTVPLASNAAESRTPPQIRSDLIDQLRLESQSFISNLVFRLSSFASVRSEVFVKQLCPQSLVYNTLKHKSDVGGAGFVTKSGHDNSEIVVQPILFQVFTKEFRVGVDGQL